MLNSMVKLLHIPLLTFISSLLFSPTVFAVTLSGISTNAKYAYIVDSNTDTVLLDHHSTDRMYPASMTKIMTAYIAFQAIRQGIIQPEDKIHISRKAHKMGGSRMFIRQGSLVEVMDILRGIIIQSGNDASVALAEHIGGDEAKFAEIMNETAQELGMNGSNFVNASGWPDENHYTTAKDLAILSERLIEDFPEYYSMFSEKSFTFSNITQNNRNGLIGEDGVDGVKTGHTEASGYGQVTSAIIDGRRLILVINGLSSATKRTSETAKLMNWGFRSTKNFEFYTLDDIVDEVPIWYGEKNTLSLSVKKEVSLTLPKSQVANLQRTITYNKPIKAPVQAGDEIGQLHIHNDDKILFQTPLYASETIAEKGFLSTFQSNINYLLWGTTP